MLNQESTALVARQDLTNETLVLILAGGRGSRLYELTDKRAKPAVYFEAAVLLTLRYLTALTQIY